MKIGHCLKPTVNEIENKNWIKKTCKSMGFFFVCTSLKHIDIIYILNKRFNIVNWGI